MTHFIKVPITEYKSLVIFEVTLDKLNIIVDFANDLSDLEYVLEVEDHPVRVERIQDQISDIEDVLKTLGCVWTSNTSSII